MLIGTNTFLFGTLTLHVIASATRICTYPSTFRLVQHNLKLPGISYVSMSAVGLLKCAQYCLKRKWCRSFNYDLGNGNCEMNFASLSLGSSSGTRLEPASGFVFSEITHWPQRMAGGCANHNCTTESTCEEIDESHFSCIGSFVSACAKVKECDPSSPDGEYWLRLPNFDLYRTRIYCHNMNTNNPLEYLSLPTPNYGIYPEVSNARCNGETGLSGNCVGEGGEVWYNKIRVKIENMEVDRTDVTFATLTNYKLNFAEAMDCYSHHENGVVSLCGTRGEFTVNLTGTGWAVRANQSWTAAGYKSVIESIVRSETGSVVHLKCGGRRGFCPPTDPLTLTTLQTEAIEESSATEVKC
ncbi:A disintegrin and metalloproteinase with thrombospondin motifs 9-like [Haliotis asinina]|uniref:A disintegrin and metalloproteinase with thrombospondin motifs 9-like n=1 Tax=Haliotis asinina TaxID=109174 RepID=UPI003532176F